MTSKRPAPIASPEQSVAMTADEFVTAFEDLVVRAKAAGLQPYQLVARATARKASSALDRLFGALEGGQDEPPR
jgi:hypothetical protein